ncbi:hypothetical protein QA648_31775 (plasmid) [Rhizobium sp. CB3171]|uniref:hypothetical protein n=1 Tax=Rhizobium sp. CB3171 TaxID=3039157 RepID=UPI0024B0653E|nr:hypothetical protein [Rhizobium sp. CB3171]WFU06678.1 hypothetical protein QA648_31775 [Rhizobium sp. CB3171]
MRNRSPFAVKTSVSPPSKAVSLPPSRIRVLIRGEGRGHILQSPLTLLREMSPEAREQHLAEYRAGFTITPFN